jgi:hypothetical protein
LTHTYAIPPGSRICLDILSEPEKFTYDRISPLTHTIVAAPGTSRKMSIYSEFL